MIETDRLLALFERLISFDSPSYGERMIGDYVKAHLASLGITAMNNCHSTDEYTTVSELERSAALALELMRSQE